MEISNLKCRKCGAPVSIEQKKCSKCGAPVLLRLMQQEEKQCLSSKEIREKEKRMRKEYEKLTEKKEKRTATGKTKANNLKPVVLWGVAIIGVITIIAYSGFAIFGNSVKNIPTSTTADTSVGTSDKATEENGNEVIVTEKDEDKQVTPSYTEKKSEKQPEKAEEPKAEEKKSEKPKKDATPKEQEKPQRQITRNNYLFPSDTQKLVLSDLEGLSQYDTGLIRNEIFARKGYIFKNDPYKDYFNSQAWYNPSSSGSPSLNEIEKYNNNFIIEYEKSQGWR